MDINIRECDPATVAYIAGQLEAWLPMMEFGLEHDGFNPLSPNKIATMLHEAVVLPLQRAARGDVDDGLAAA